MAKFCAVTCLDTLIDQAVGARASDIHIRFEHLELIVDIRVDGRLKRLFQSSDPDGYQLIARIKSLAMLDVAQRRLAQDGKIVMTVRDTLIDIRVATMPAQWAEAVSLRLLYPEHARLNLIELGCTDVDVERIRSSMQPPHGLILITGPTGSGKSTTLRSLTSYLDTDRFRIVTLEDPIEYTMPGVTQCHLAPHLGFDVQTGLKAVLRQDPDVVVIGEIRDLETARVAVQAALTGHLVLSTLHTNDAVGTLIRLLDMRIPPFLVQAAVRCIVAQRLVRRVCRACHNTSISPNRCTHCQETGYVGRQGIFEVLPITASIRQALGDSPTYQSLCQAARAEGHRSLYDHGVDLVAQGVTTELELAAVCAAIAP